MKRRTLAAAVAAMLAVCILGGCARADNNAVMLDDNAKSVIDETAFSASYTPVQFTYPAGEGSIFEEGDLYGYLVVRSAEEAGAVFLPGAAPEIDYEKELLVIFVFTAIYTHKIDVKRAEAENGVLDIQLKMKMPKRLFPVGDATAPARRFVVIKADKTGVTDVSIRLL
jgi:hypothetical protein